MKWLQESWKHFHTQLDFFRILPIHFKCFGRTGIQFCNERSGFRVQRGAENGRPLDDMPSHGQALKALHDVFLQPRPLRTSVHDEEN